MRSSYLSSSSSSAAVLLLVLLLQEAHPTSSLGRGNKNLGGLFDTYSRSKNKMRKQQQKRNRHRTLRRKLDDVPPWFDSFTDAPTDYRTERPIDVVDTASPTAAPTTAAPTRYPTAAPTDPVVTPSPTVAPTQALVTPSPTIPPTSALPTLPPTIPPTSALPTLPPTIPPTLPPTTAAPITQPPTVPPTTAAPITQPPTIPPTAQPESTVQSTVKADGGQLSNCSYVPDSGASVTETFDLEYFLYLNDATAGVTDTASVQALVDQLQQDLHTSLATSILDCSDFITKPHVFVSVSNQGPGSDLVGAQCSLGSGSGDISLDATSCHQVWAQVTVAVWFPGSGARRLNLADLIRRQLQTSPFGDPTAFATVTEQLEIAFALLPDPESGVLETEFKGFVNVGDIGGTVLSDPTDAADTTDSFIDSAQSKENTGLPFSYGHAAILLAGLVMFSLVAVVLLRRRRNRRAYKEHLKQVDALELDPIDEYGEDPEVVDDASLFQEEPLPEQFEVQLEDSYHDYRTCASPSCRACLQRKDPVFVNTDVRGLERSSWRPSSRKNQRRLPSVSDTVDDTQLL